MTFEIGEGACRLLLQLVLAQRLEINALESTLKNIRVLADSEIMEIRLQAFKTAEAWSRDGGTDLLGMIRMQSSPYATMIRMHSSPYATMLAPLSQEAKDELLREIKDQLSQRGGGLE
jgi:hypothetical protein